MKLHHHPDYNQRACKDKPAPYDHLIDYTEPSMYVILESFALCAACPIMSECWDTEAGEEWLNQLNTPRAKAIIKTEAERQRNRAQRSAERVA